MLFKRALASFDDAFKSANFSFDDLLPVSQNRTYRAANMIDRLTYTVVRTDCTVKCAQEPLSARTQTHRSVINDRERAAHDRTTST